MKKKRHSHNHTVHLQHTYIFKGLQAGLLMLACIGIAVIITKTFKIEHLKCELDNGEQCPQVLIDSLKTFNGKPMFFSNYHYILSNEIHLSQPYSLKSYSKYLPNTVHLVFSQEHPLVVLNQSGSYHVISDSGKSFPQPDPSAIRSDILLVETNDALIEDNILVPDVLSVFIQIKQSQESYRLPIEKVTWLDKSTIQLSMKDRTEVAIIDSESPVLQLQRLSIILQSKEYQEISEAKRELDVRFTMPVLRTEP